VRAHFIADSQGSAAVPSFPFLCLTVSGGHTQIVMVHDHYTMEILGRTIDDAAGEAFDKAAKIMGLPYPGGPAIDKLAESGDAKAFTFPKPNIPGLDFSFSGLKTSFLYFIRDQLKKDAGFIEKNKSDLSASIQDTIVDILISKLTAASRQTGIREIAIAGGVAANSCLRKKLTAHKDDDGWNLYLPRFEYSTDNAAMIAAAAYFKFRKGLFAQQDVAPYSRSGK
jgi:N6-L-threonylcarbamoyladenine synthase